jgi:succinate dehydrogenase hydrophobic anchor subunit
MAVHDNERRTARDYMHNARTRYDDTSSGSRWIGIVVGLALLAFIVYMLYAAATGPDTTGDAVRQTPQNPTTTTAPRTTTPAPTGPTTQPQ